MQRLRVLLDQRVTFCEQTRSVAKCIVAIALIQAPPCHGAESARPTDRTPPLRVVDELLSLHDMAGLSVSPAGDEALFQVQWSELETNAVKAEWVAVKLNGPSRRRAFVDAGDPIFPETYFGRPSGVRTTLPPRWSPDGRSIAYVRRSGSDNDLWVVHSDGTHPRSVTRGNGDVIRFAWRGSKALVYELSELKGQRGQLRAVEGRRGFLLDERFDPWFSSQPLRMPQASIGREAVIRRISLDSSATTKASADDVQHLNAAGPFSIPLRATGSSLFFTEQQPLPPEVARSLGLANARLLSIGRKGIAWAELENSVVAGAAAPSVIRAALLNRLNTPILCAADACRGLITDVAWTPNGQRLVFSRWEGWANGEQGMYLWDPFVGTVRRLSRSDEVLSDCNVLNERAICFSESPLQPRIVVSMGFDSGVVETIYDPNPQLKQDALCSAERIVYKDEFGNEAFGYYVSPCGKKSRPAPLVLVGYRANGFLRGGVGDEYPIQAFAKAGIGVLVYDAPNDWGLDANVLDGDERERLEWKDFRERRSAWSALQNAINLLVDRGDVDPTAIGITGLSDAAETAAWALAHGTRFAAAILSTPTWDPIHYDLIGSRSLAADLPGFGLGPLNSEEGAGWQEMSIALNYARITTPILGNLADHEMLRFLQTKSTLEYYGRPIEVYVYPDEYHIKWQPTHRAAIYARNLQWMRFWLCGVRDANPVDDLQYERWADLLRARDELFASPSRSARDKRQTAN